MNCYGRLVVVRGERHGCHNRVHRVAGASDVVAWCRDRSVRYEVPQDLKVVDAIPRTPKDAIDGTARWPLIST